MTLKITNLITKLKKYNNAYRKGNPIVSDSEYDSNVELLRSLDPYNPFLTKVEPEIFQEKRRVYHKSYMLSMEKAYSLSELERFVKRVRKYARSVDIRNLKFKLTAKLDGLAANDDGKILASRGNGIVGYDISSVFLKGVIPIGGRGKGLGEIIVVKSYFEKNLINFFEHPRNMVVGIVSSDNLSKNVKIALNLGKIHFMPYILMKSILVDSNKLIKEYKDLYKLLLVNIRYPVDGIVIEVNNSIVKKIMGFTSHHYRWQIALKTRGKTADTVVKKIQWQVGRSGNITPVLEVKPIYISGANIKRISAHNAGYIRDLKIGEGTLVKVIRSGEVIPKLDSVIKSLGTVIIPNLCPVCEEKLSWDKDFIICKNIECTERKAQHIIHWFKILNNTDWFGIKTIHKIVKNGFNNLESVYDLKYTNFKLMGFGDKQSKNLFDSINRSKINPVDDWRFLAAFGIPGLGLGCSLKILKNIPINDIPYIKKEILISINGFGNKTSHLIANGISQKKATILNMLSMNFNLILTKNNCNFSTINNFFIGKNVVFTGKMITGSRIQMKNKAVNTGIKVQSKINKNTNYLIVGANGSKHKLNFAKLESIPILTEKEYYNILKKFIY